MKILDQLRVRRGLSSKSRYLRFAREYYPSCDVCVHEALALCEALEKLTGQPLALSTVDESIFEITGGREAIRNGADSLDQVELVAALEEEFGLTIPDDSDEASSDGRTEQVFHVVLGRSAGHSTWEHDSIWVRSFRSVIHERSRHSGRCRCLDKLPVSGAG